MTSFCQDIYEMLCRKYPNRNIYIIGDQHFYHENIVKYARNNFLDATEMNEYIIKQHNATITEEDIVIFLGDFCFKRSCIKEMMDQMHGHKYLILGNHDSENIVKNYPSLGFEGVFISPIKIQNKYLSHEPLMESEKSDLHFQMIVKEFQKSISGINYHGHIHDKNSFIAPNYINATCESLNYRPMLIGQTKSISKQDEKSLFINSSYFDDIVTLLNDKHHINTDILLGDYIYSFVLEVCSSFHSQYFIQGSFGLLKKYNFLSNMSDLDISFIYDQIKSKGVNIALFKNMIDACYDALKKIDEINLRFVKRYPSLRSFETLYTSKSSYFAQCFLDANLVFLNCYKDTDFQMLEEKSIIEKYLFKEGVSLLDEYQFPHFQSQFLIPEGDIANLTLQILFQQGYKEKRLLALKKITIYLCSYYQKGIYG